MQKHHRTTPRYAFIAGVAMGGVICFSSPIAHAQINLGGVNPTTYNQNFDTPTLSSVGGSTQTYQDNVTIKGLYASRGGAVPTTYTVSSGNNTATNIYSYGQSGNSDRALGSIINNVANAFYGFRFVNTSVNKEIASFTIQYTGEFWRRGGNAANPTQELRFGFAVFDAGTGSIAASADYNSYIPLDYRVTDGGTATAGSTAPLSTQSFNQTVILDLQDETVKPGQELWVRWQDTNDVGNDHGLAIDNVQMNFNLVTVVPEASTFPLVATGLIGMGTAFVVRRRKRTN